MLREHNTDSRNAFAGSYTPRVPQVDKCPNCATREFQAYRARPGNSLSGKAHSP